METQRHQDLSALYQQHVNNTRQQMAGRIPYIKAVFYTSTLKEVKEGIPPKTKPFSLMSIFFPSPPLFIHIYLTTRPTDVRDQKLSACTATPFSLQA